MRHVSAGQAAYGEKGRGHALLGSSPGAAIASEVVNQMDIQASPPPGVNWPAYWSGLPLEDTYILARTALDPDAVRSGMVRTRALFFALSDVGQMGSLGAAMRFLVNSFAEQGPYEDVALAVEDRGGKPHRGLAEALLAAGDGVTVWAFPQGFEDALDGLWSNLWPEARRALSFRLAFSPQDVTDRTPTIVTTLPSLVPRWAGSNVVREASDGPIDAATALLLGEPSSVPLRETMSGFDAGLPDVAGLSKIVALHDAIAGSAGPGELVGALRLVCHLSPDPGAGAEQKETLVARCAAAIPGAGETDVRMARNLDLSAIADPAPFWSAIRQWAGKGLWKSSAKSVERVIADALDAEGPVREWREAVLAGTADFLSSSDGNGGVIWDLLTHAPELTEPILARAPNRGGLEKRLLEALPRKITSTAAGPLLDAVAAVGSMRLHAAVCSAAFKPVRAASEHLLRAPDDAEVGTAMARGNDEDIVAAALANASDRLFSMAAEASATSPGLLGPLEITHPGWRRIWREALAINPACWQGPRDPRSAMDALLTALVEKAFVDEPLLLLLSTSPLADVLAHPRRPELWIVLPAQASPRILARAADTWVTNFKAGLEQARPEPELAAAVLEPARVETLLRELELDPALGCQAFHIFAELTEPRFLRWLDRVLNSSQSPSAAAAIGRLAAVRSWKDTAKTLGDRVLDGRRDLEPAMDFCVDLVPWLMRYRLGGPVAPAAKWQIFEELGLDLYPYGPGQDYLWERAGGKEADIPKTSTGREAWHKVVIDLANGRGGVSLQALVREMAEDHRLNPALAKMRDDRFFR
ncbi:hypothetical protein ASG47_07035 [Devosia sp. Leaf420]|uniref:GAP1-N1 domain-containing protein n=1 Tax=Devosia sp. Leaf420 TaxID=1736374 RepID=UPI000714FBD8|nr:effector-associated domain EAD1-containing protein [Devosia sp. Leaf420]KQT48123.1 hypothetical protein ASG47_07035 [Devosia sp. Leaf420]